MSEGPAKFRLSYLILIFIFGVVPCIGAFAWLCLMSLRWV